MTTAELLLAFILPSTFLTACCATGALLIVGRRRIPFPPGFGRLLLCIGVAGLTVIFWLPVDVWALRPLENRFPRAPLPARIDGVVVLGGGLTATIAGDRGTSGLNRDGERLTTFVTMARNHPEAKLVFAGGPPPPPSGRTTEADASRAFLDRLGIDPKRVLFDEMSRNTHENAVNALALAHPHPGETWVLITSASHMPRAMGAFAGAGWPELSAMPVAYRTNRAGWPPPLRPFGTKLAGFDLAAHEWAGLLEYKLRHYADRIFPRPDR